MLTGRPSLVVVLARMGKVLKTKIISFLAGLPAYMGRKRQVQGRIKDVKVMPQINVTSEVTAF